MMLAKESRRRHVEPHPVERAVIAGDVLDRSSDELAAVIQHFQDENPCIKRVTRIRRAGPVASDPVDRLPAPGDSLAEHLARQLSMGTHDRRTLALANWIIWNLDGEGYLREDLAELATTPGAGVAELERALAVVQSLDPVGVGARSLRECLLLQMRAQADPDPVAILLVDALPEGAVREALRGPRPRALPAVRPRHAGAGRNPPPGAATGQTLRRAPRPRPCGPRWRSRGPETAIGWSYAMTSCPLYG